MNNGDQMAIDIPGSGVATTAPGGSANPIRETLARWDHPSLVAHTREYIGAYRAMQALDLQVKAFERNGALPAVAMAAHADYAAVLKRVAKQKIRECMSVVRNSDVWAFVRETHGLSNTVALILGMYPVHIGDMHTVSACWKWLGLDVRDGVAPKRRKGERCNWNPMARAFALYRLGDPIIKVGGPYRAVYDARKAYTLTTHPPMWVDDVKELAYPNCADCRAALDYSKALRARKNNTRERVQVAGDCANMGGIHWTKGHRHADALRYMVKAIIRDLWRVDNGQKPKL